MQNTRHLLMIEPVHFGFNDATAVNNVFQKKIAGDVQQAALEEFNNFVDLLQQNEIDITVVKDSTSLHTPDSIFPNNWISFQENNTVFLYPMFAINRRLERSQTVIEMIKEKFIVEKTIDLTNYEKDQLYLEGTGSMVLDRTYRIAYACISPRTSTIVLDEFCRINNYTAVHFVSKDSTGVEIYHTNVMMCMADEYVVVCLDSVEDEKQKERLISTFQLSTKDIITINFNQMNQFAGNMLQVINKQGEKLLIMSSRAYTSLSTEQLNQLKTYNRIIHSPLDTIETVGGGSARCMLAEVFLQPK